MSKRTATELLSTSINQGQAFQKASGSGAKRENVETDEMGEFEDAWEDEIQSDEDVVDEKAAEGEDGALIIYDVLDYRIYIYEGMDVDQVLPAIEESEQPDPPAEAYIPGTHVLGKDETLEADDSVYIMRHVMKVTWPCLSFDVLRDNWGDQRQRYPATAYLVAGTQAQFAKDNELVVYKLSSLHRTQKDGGE